VQQDDACTRATEVAHGELHSAGIHNEVCRVVRQGGGDGTSSRRSALSEPITEFNSGIGTRDDKPRLPLTRLPTLVSKALYRATAEIDVVRVNDGPPPHHLILQPTVRFDT
jgi:hypothetical protein